MAGGPGIARTGDPRLLAAQVASASDAGGFFHAATEDGRRFRLRCALPGERVLLAPRPSDPGWGDLQRLLRESSGRREAPCAAFGRCGGCHWQHGDEAAQRRLRLARLRVALRRGGVAPGTPAVIDVVSPGPALAYRHRARFQISGEGQRFGFHAPHSREVIDLPRCPLLAPDLARIARLIREELLPEAGRGLNGVEVLALPRAGGALCLLNPRDRPPMGWPALGERWLEQGRGAIAGVGVQAVDGRRPAHLGSAAQLGRSPAGLPVAGALGGFVQSHLAAAELLAQTVVEMARIREGTPVTELYAGSGFLGWRLAHAGAHVEAVESDPRNAAAAALLPPPPHGRLSLIQGRAERSLFGADTEVLVADPPRAGLGALAARIGREGPGRLVLVSCSLRGLSRDLNELQAGGYRLARVAAIEMFPQTRHLETVSLLLRTSNRG